MPDIESMISAQRIISIKRYLSHEPSNLFLDFYLKKVGGKFLFYCNFSYPLLPRALPEFYKECLVAWTSLSQDNPLLISETANQVIWNNRFICIESKSIYNQRLIDFGIVKVGDLCDSRGELKSNKEPLHSILSPIEHFLLFSIFSAIPQEWRKTLKANKLSVSLNTRNIIPGDFYLHIKGKITNLEKLHSKEIYDSLIFKISNTPTAQKKYNEIFNTNTFQLDWEKICLLPYETTLDTKLREFQYKILNRILYTNDMLFKFKKVESPLCDFCGNEMETLEHLRCFGGELKELLNSIKITVNSFEIKDLLFGILGSSHGGVLLNYIILESKFFIYRSKLTKKALCLTSLVAKFKRTFESERLIARKNNKLKFHYKKWNPLLPMIESSSRYRNNFNVSRTLVVSVMIHVT